MVHSNFLFLFFLKKTPSGGCLLKARFCGLNNFGVCLLWLVECIIWFCCSVIHADVDIENIKVYPGNVNVHKELTCWYMT